MSWAHTHIAALRAGMTIKFRPRGRSMEPRIMSGQLVTVRPLLPGEWVMVNDAVLCTMPNGAQYVHLVKAIADGPRFQIGNNKGRINGWVGIDAIHGKVTAVEP